MNRSSILLTPESIHIDSDPLLKERVNDTTFYMLDIAWSSSLLFEEKGRGWVEINIPIFNKRASNE